MASEMEVAALGRPFTLGTLYDACEEKITAFTPWNAETLNKYTVSGPQPSSDCDISVSDTMESKSNLLDIKASLEASFMSGLFTVKGSAEYLNDTKKSEDQIRLTFQYKATTHFEMLKFDNISLDADQKDIIERSSATHVVTGITYGANAFFVFDSEKMDAKNVQNIQGSMEAAMNKLSTAVKANASVKLNTEEEEVTKKFTCKFYGDVILDRNPLTFEDAMKTCAEIKKLLGESREKRVPMKVMLTPLRKWHPDVPEVKDISPHLMMKVQNALEELKEIDMRCNNSLDVNVVKNFPHVSKEFRDFQELCGTYTTKLKKTMKEKLPSIRKGKEVESTLEQFFDDRDKSPFSNEKLTEWLDHTEVEITTIKSCVEVSGEIKCFKSPSQLKAETLGMDDTLCFVFTFLEHGDPCLDVMAEYLKSPAAECTHGDPWHSSDDVLTKMQEKGKAFQDLAKALKNHKDFRFLVAAIENEKYKGATIHHYKNGSLVTEDFSKPDLPPVRTITNRRDLIWYATDLTLDKDTANYYIMLSDDKKKATYGSWQYYDANSERFDYPQVMCQEGLEGRHYWEVEWSTGGYDNVYLAAAYKRVQRKGDGSALHNNDAVWGFCKTSTEGEISAYHKGVIWKGRRPSNFSRVGVFLDWPAGTLSFYQVSSNTVSHLYTLEDTFTEPVYPILGVHDDGVCARLHFAE